MNASEVLANLPLLIYGIAIAELFSQWKRFINFKNVYAPYALMTIVLTEVALYTVFLFAQLVDEIQSMSYRKYLVYLFPCIVFMITVYSFTPEKEDDTEDYFKKNIPVVFGLISIFVASHFLYVFDETRSVIIGRISILALLILTVIFRKIWMIYLFIIVWFVMLFFR